MSKKCRQAYTELFENSKPTKNLVFFGPKATEHDSNSSYWWQPFFMDIWEVF